MDRRINRVQEIALPILRAAMPDMTFTSWGADVDYRVFPYVNLRRLGGLPDPGRPNLLDKPVLEVTAYSAVNLIDCEEIVYDVRHHLWEAVERQTVTDAGYFHSYFETLGPTQFDSPFEDTWRVQFLVQLGVRPPRNS
jgi:hypothetical protein